MSDVTVGELVRTIGRLEKRVEDLEKELEAGYAKKDAVNDRLGKLESRSEWIVRTVGALIIAALLGVVLVSNKAVPSSGKAADVTNGSATASTCPTPTPTSQAAPYLVMRQTKETDR